MNARSLNITYDHSLQSECLGLKEFPNLQLKASSCILHACIAFQQLRRTRNARNALPRIGSDKVLRHFEPCAGQLTFHLLPLPVDCAQVIRIHLLNLSYNASIGQPKELWPRYSRACRMTNLTVFSRVVMQ